MMSLHNSWKEYHRRWTLALLILLALLALLPPAAQSFKESLDAKRDTLTAQRERQSRQLNQWREDAQTAIAISRSISAQGVESLLAPSDRDLMAAQIEPLAASVHLTNVHYALSPAQPWDGGAAYPGIQGLAQSRLSIEADAPHDGNMFAFLDQIGKLQGKMMMQSLQITPIKSANGIANDNPTAAISAANLHLKVEYIWLANEGER